MKAAGRGAQGSAESQRRGRWRPRQAAPRSGRGRGSARIWWTVASIALLAALALLVIPPFFVRHAAVVQLVIDDYEQGVVAPVPFGPEDTAAIGTALAGRLSPAVGAPPRSPLALEAVGTAATLREPLFEQMVRLPLRRRDTLVALVRGQTIVAAGADGEPAAHLVAGDVSLARAAPAEIVPCRELFAAFAAAPAGTTLVAFDLGDIRWDPRLGTLAGLVPAQLDRDTRQPLARAAGAAAGEPAEDCWILSSHDTDESSGASLVARRSFFSRALELGLSGEADDRSWAAAGGDGDGIVELDELVRFTAACTSAWARRESNDEFDQRPVLWLMGKGRVSIDEIPRGIQIVRTGSRRSRMPPVAQIAAAGAGSAVQPADVPSPPPSGTSVPGAAAVSGSATTSSAALAAPAAASPAPAGGAPPARLTLWELLDRAGQPATAEAAAPIDYAPHLWRQAAATAAATAESPDEATATGRRAADLVRRMEVGLERFIAGDDNVSAGRDDPVARLREARRSAAGAGILSAWAGCPVEVRKAVAVRNRAVACAVDTAGWLGRSAGSSRTASIVASLDRLVDLAAALHAAIGRAVAGGAADATAGGFGSLTSATHAVESAVAAIRADTDAAVDGLIAATRSADRLPSADIRRLLASTIPSAVQRTLLEEVVRQRREQATAPAVASGEPTPQPKAEPPAAAAWLSPETVLLRVPAEPRPPLGRDRWEAVVAGADRVWRLLGICGDVGSRGDASLAAFDAAFADLKRRLQAGDLDRIADGTVRVGGMLAEAQARIPQDVETALLAASGGRRTSAGGLRRSGFASGDPLATVDALLRVVDPRDVNRIPTEARGWVPPLKAAPPLKLAVTAVETRLEVDAPRRAAIAMASGAAFPSGGTIVLEFDATRLRVRAAGGDVIESGRPVKVEMLASRDRLLVDVSARTRVGAGDADRKATLAATCVAGTRRDGGSIAFEMPIVERLAVAVRGPKGAVEGGVEQPGGWRRVVVDTLGTTDAGDGDAAARSGGTPAAETIRLRPFPGHVTPWEVAVFNQTGTNRRVAVDLVSCTPVEVTGEAASNAARMDETWRQLCFAVARRRPPPPGARIVASLPAIELADSDHRVDLFLPLPPQSAVTGTASGDAGKPATAAALGSTLGLVIRDLVAGEQPAGAGAADRPATPGLAAADARVWVVRLPLEPQHPRRYVDAAATWSREDRSITIGLEPRRGDASLLPAAGARVRGGPLDPDRGGQPVAMRKLEALLAAAQPNDVLRAQWNGPLDGEARLAVEIDGHPRARVFRVDCGPAASGVEQGPQEDWRQVAFLTPDRDLAAYRAPADTIPLVVAFDGPPDAFGAAGGTVDLTVREVRNLGDGLPDAGRVVWSAESDRQATFSAEPAPPPAALAVRTVVSDWAIPLSKLGFQDVDVILEARLRLGGNVRPFTASRTIVLDGSPPRVAAQPRLRAEKGKPAVLVVMSDDGLQANAAVGGRRAGASGVERTEWGFDTKRNKAPEKWEPVPSGSDGEWRVQIPTESLAIGSHRIAVRAFDRVGLESEPAFVELEVVPPPPPPAPGTAPEPDRTNGIVGRVTFNGQPISGARVTVRGPSGPDSATSGPDGSFSLSGLEPGSYELAVPPGTIPGKNRLGEAKPQAVTVAPPPAKPATVDLRLQ